MIFHKSNTVTIHGLNQPHHNALSIFKLSMQVCHLPRANVVGLVLSIIITACEGYIFTGICLFNLGGRHEMHHGISHTVRGGGGGPWSWGVISTSPPPLWLMCRRYTSYWNAFLSIIVFLHIARKYKVSPEDWRPTGVVMLLKHYGARQL